MALETITIHVNCTNAIEKKQLETLFGKLAKVPTEDRNRLAQIIDSPKALKGLKDKWLFLKTMFT